MNNPLSPPATELRHLMAVCHSWAVSSAIEAAPRHLMRIGACAGVPQTPCATARTTVELPKTCPAVILLAMARFSCSRASSSLAPSAMHRRLHAMRKASYVQSRTSISPSSLYSAGEMHFTWPFSSLGKRRQLCQRWCHCRSRARELHARRRRARRCSSSWVSFRMNAFASAKRPDIGACAW